MKKLRLSNSLLSELYYKLALFLQSGIQPADGLAILADEETDRRIRAYYSDASRLLDGGESLSAALSAGGEVPAYAAELLKIGESVGRTEETLLSLSKYFEHRAVLSRRIRRALVYPSVLLAVMAAVIVILLTRVLPVFNGVYASLGGSLTGLAAGLLRIGEALSTSLPYVGAVLGVLAAVVMFVLACRPVRRAFRRFFARFSGSRGISGKLNTAHFAQAFAMGIGSGMTVDEAVETAAALLTSSPGAAKRCRACCERIADGDEPFEVLSDGRVLPASSCRMLKLGMRAGKLDETAWSVADKLSEEADDALCDSISRIEPALVLITSVLVGVILLSVMIPLVNIMKAI